MTYPHSVSGDVAVTDASSDFAARMDALTRAVGPLSFYDNPWAWRLAMKWASDEAMRLGIHVNSPVSS